MFPDSISLKSKEAKWISKFFKQKAREESFKKGEGVLRRFFGLFGRK